MAVLLHYELCSQRTTLEDVAKNRVLLQLSVITTTPPYIAAYYRNIPWVNTNNSFTKNHTQNYGETGH